MAVKLKDPQESIDYAIDWSDFMAASETISASSWSVTSTALSIGTVAATTLITAAFVSGGVNGDVYRLTNKITTNQTRVAERSVIIRVEER
jgi:hypothetical protein